MSDRIPAARFVAYSVILAAGIPASITTREWWTLSLPIIAIVFVEAVMITDRVRDFLWGKTREFVIEQAAKRAVELILAEQRSREATGLIASMRGRLPDYIVDAAESGRLEIRVREEE